MSSRTVYTFEFFLQQDIITDLNAEGEPLPIRPINEDWIGHKVGHIFSFLHFLFFLISFPPCDLFSNGSQCIFLKEPFCDFQRFSRFFNFSGHIQLSFGLFGSVCHLKLRHQRDYQVGYNGLPSNPGSKPQRLGATNYKRSTSNKF